MPIQETNEESHLIRFRGEISSKEVDSILQKIENSIDNVKWMKSVLRVSYDLLISGYANGDEVDYILDKSNGNYQIFCKHNKVPANVAGFIVKSINRLRDYDEDRLRDLIKRLAIRHSPTTERETFFEDIIWSIYNIYRRKYATIVVNKSLSDKEFVILEFIVSFDFES